MPRADNPLRNVIDIYHESMYEALTLMKEHVPGGDRLDPAITDFGVRVKITEVGWVVLTRQLVNWRIVDCRNDPFSGTPTELSGYTRGWCYAGPHSFALALHAAVTWSGSPDTEPSGWIKSVVDGRRNGEPTPGIRQE
jgi:hypothetical protein